MGRRRSLVVAVVVALLAACAAAALAAGQAASPPPLRVAAESPARDHAGVQRLLAAADAHWRRRGARRLPPDCAAGLDVREGGPAHGAVAGYAEPPCRVWLNPAAWSRRTGGWRATLCDVVVHEVGHLLGLGHSDVATDVMAPELPARGQPRAPECRVPRG